MCLLLFLILWTIGDASVVLPSTEVITTSSGCRVQIAREILIPEITISFVNPKKKKEEVLCPAGYRLYVTREDKFGYVVKDSLVCSKEKSFETKGSGFPVDAKDSIACLAGNITQFNPCEVIIGGHSVHVIKEIHCPSNYVLRIFNKTNFPEGKGLTCAKGRIISDCSVKHKGLPSVQCIPKAFQTREQEEEDQFVTSKLHVQEYATTANLKNTRPKASSKRPKPTSTTPEPPSTTPEPTTTATELVDLPLPDSLLSELALRQKWCNSEVDFPFPAPPHYAPCPSPKMSANANVTEDSGRRCIELTRVCGRIIKSAEAYEEAKTICPIEGGSLSPIYQTKTGLQTWRDNGKPLLGYVARQEGACGANVKVQSQIEGGKDTYYTWE